MNGLKFYSYVGVGLSILQFYLCCKIMVDGMVTLIEPTRWLIFYETLVFGLLSLYGVYMVWCDLSGPRVQRCTWVNCGHWQDDICGLVDREEYLRCVKHQLELGS